MVRASTEVNSSKPLLTMDQLILSSTTRKQLKAYLAKPSHALLLIGEVGCGLGAIARALAHELANADVIYIEPTLHKQQKTEIINADDIADLGSILRDKRQHQLVVILDGADQTANGVFERMLKLIEEPVAGIHFIFTAHTLHNIPATILSRSSLIRVKSPREADCEVLFSNKLDSKTTAQIKFIASGRPALIRRLIDNKELFATEAASFEAAKHFLQGNVASRLAIVNDIDNLKAGIKLCADIARLEQQLATKKVADAKRLSRRLGLLSTTADNLTANGNTRIQLVNLAINY